VNRVVAADQDISDYLLKWHWKLKRLRGKWKFASAYTGIDIEDPCNFVGETGGKRTRGCTGGFLRGGTNHSFQVSGARHRTGATAIRCLNEKRIGWCLSLSYSRIERKEIVVFGRKRKVIKKTRYPFIDIL